MALSGNGAGSLFWIDSVLCFFFTAKHIGYKGANYPIETLTRDPPLPMSYLFDLWSPNHMSWA